MPKTKKVVLYNSPEKPIFSKDLIRDDLVFEETSWVVERSGKITTKILRVERMVTATRFERKTALLGLIHDRIERLRYLRGVAPDYNERGEMIQEQERQTERFNLIGRFF